MDDLATFTSMFGRKPPPPGAVPPPMLAGAVIGGLLGTMTGLLHTIARPLTGEGEPTAKEALVHGLIGATMGTLIGAISGRAASSVQRAEDAPSAAGAIP